MNGDWERFGEDIRRTVQDAVDSQDFNRLNQTISNTINGAMDGLEKGLHSVGDAVGDAVDKTAQSFKYQSGKNGPYMNDTYRYRRNANRDFDRFNREYARDAAKEWRARKRSGMDTQAYQAAPDAMTVQRMRELFAQTGGAKAGGIALAVTGGILGGSMVILILLLILGAAMSGRFDLVISIILGVCGVFAMAGIVMTGIGRKLLGRVKRFRNYMKELDGRDYCEIKELSERLRIPQKYLVKDMEKLIQKRWFRQGHLDKQKTCLIVSNEAYKQYMELIERKEKEKLEEATGKAQQAEAKKGMDPQLQEIIETGDEYIRKIRKSNDAIPGAEISAKISRMEMLVDRIFDRVEQNPENIPDVRRLMEYYLPTTVKLLEAYEQLDAQPVQGENIISSKKEIEKTLDTLNVAFEKLLDGMFQDTAWNVSADISVLNTMLAQEGLAKDDFKK